MIHMNKILKANATGLATLAGVLATTSPVFADETPTTQTTDNQSAITKLASETTLPTNAIKTVKETTTESEKQPEKVKDETKKETATESEKQPETVKNETKKETTITTSWIIKGGDKDGSNLRPSLSGYHPDHDGVDGISQGYVLDHVDIDESTGNVTNYYKKANTNETEETKSDELKLNQLGNTLQTALNGKKADTSTNNQKETPKAPETKTPTKTNTNTQKPAGIPAEETTTLKEKLNRINELAPNTYSTDDIKNITEKYQNLNESSRKALIAKLDQAITALAPKKETPKPVSEETNKTPETTTSTAQSTTPAPQNGTGTALTTKGTQGSLPTTGTTESFGLTAAGISTLLASITASQMVRRKKENEG